MPIVYQLKTPLVQDSLDLIMPKLSIVPQHQLYMLKDKKKLKFIFNF